MSSQIIGGVEVWFKLPIYQILHVHQIIIPYCWTVLINIAIFMAIYRYRRYAIFIHFFICFSVSMFTLVTSIPLFGIPSHTKPLFLHHMVLTITHCIVVIMFIQVIIGILTKLLNFWKIKSVPLYRICKIHKWLGYALTLLCKILSYLLIQKGVFYWIMIGQEVVFISMLVYRKYTMSLLEQKIEPTYDNLHVQIVSSLNQVKDHDKKDICIFSNYVYDMKPLRHNHPAGYQILELVRNREIDRFMYGMFRAEPLPKLPTNSHTFKSMQLLGDPIAQIKIKSPFRGMSSQSFKVTLQKLSQISTSSKIYQVYLKPQQSIQFIGYQCLAQLGRFYSLTLNDKVTRLYTSVNFITSQNKRLLKKLGLIDRIAFSSQSSYYSQSLSNQKYTQRGLKKDTMEKGLIPLMIKVYPKGTLPNMLINTQKNKIIMSPPKGFGLGFGEYKQGTLIILAGGTGLYPFSDLIDLLYKDYILRQNEYKNQEILVRNPILKYNPFKPFNFKIYIACQYLQDIHYITLKQLQTLSFSDKINICLKVKNINKDQIVKNQKFKLIQSKFQQILDKQLDTALKIEKVMVSGPPRMMESVSKYFQRKQATHMLLLV